MQIPGSSGTSNPSKIQFPKVHQKITRGGFQGGCGHQVCAYSSTQNFQKIVNYFNVIIKLCFHFFSPPIWFLAVLFLLFNTHGEYY